MRICLIVEERYRSQRMPVAVGEQLTAWGHDVTALEPHATATCLGKLAGGRADHDVYVLKTVTDGPGRTLIDASAAAGLVTVNDAHAIRSVRDKAVAAAVARANGVPFPTTYFLAHPRLLTQVPAELFPLVVKPSNGSEGQGVRLVESPAVARELVLSGELAADGALSFLIAQPYMPNGGYDIKVYNAGGRVFAVRRPSPLSGVEAPDEPMSVSPALRRLVLHIGRVFGLDIYGVDVLETPQGWVAVDINDFPSFSTVPEAVGWVASSIVEAANRRLARRPATVPAPRRLARRRPIFTPVPALVGGAA
jgi:ribosomal protein S6--L-glutamate ligase